MVFLADVDHLKMEKIKESMEKTVLLDAKGNPRTGGGGGGGAAAAAPAVAKGENDLFNRDELLSIGSFVCPYQSVRGMSQISTN